MIYGPCYHGQHTYIKYAELRDEILKACQNNPKVELFMDFLHDEEIMHYFLNIFSHLLIVNPKKPGVITHVKIYAKTRKRLRKARKQLRKLIIPFGEIRKEKGHYYIEAEIDS